ncbi:hypothetical protein Ddye_012355 [Dipteronia dyeriana]|uniref:Uncharacterized protein n=1 Tax=Dipteronia dyeriana TaxID=168575 RepID=A0AAD9X4A4_9ROSI|nr:hypothetical protein Ddye_012355 [Dipteronia dyeriana]
MELLPPTEAAKPRSVVQSVPLLIGKTNENIESPNEGFDIETSDDEMSNVVSNEDQFVDVEVSDTYTNNERPSIVFVRGMPYTELPSGKLTNNEEANTIGIANRYGYLIRSNHDMKISLLATYLRQNYGLVISTWKLYIAKRQALESVGEDHKAPFKKLYKNYKPRFNSSCKASKTCLGAPVHFQ